jgi:ParB/RepB/Spo0J family partition protein
MVQRLQAGQLPLGVEVQIPLERILPDDVRTRPLDEERVQGLMASFASKGQQQSIKVHPSGPFYLKVTFGEHRLEAAKRLGWKEIRGVIQPTGEHETLELKVTENAHRNGFVDPWEEGRIFAKLLSEKYGNNLNALSESLGKPTSYIKDRVQVFYSLDRSLRPYVGHQLSVANTVSLARIFPAEKQLQLASVIIKTRTSGSSGFGRGAGRGENGKFVGRTRVKVIHECTCGCGDIHENRKLSLLVDPSEEGIGAKAVMGKFRENDQVCHFERPENPGFSHCGSELKSRWNAELPEHFDTRLVRVNGATICDLCAREWRKES